MWLEKEKKGYIDQYNSYSMSTIGCLTVSTSSWPTDGLVVTFYKHTHTQC